MVVRTLEASPRFNAGVGGARQSDGLVRTDAGYMVSDGTIGAACGMKGVEHAIDVARAVATETPHVLLAGDPAVQFAVSMGIETDVDLVTGATRERWDASDAPSDTTAQLSAVRNQFGENEPPRSHDTVGAIATDGNRVVAGTSTGGRWFALAGRVGDVPQAGSGFFASPTGAASATGEGEAIARFGLARDVVDRIENGDTPQTAARDAIDTFEESTDGTAGVIAMAADGTYGTAHNAAVMQTATAIR